MNKMVPLLCNGVMEWRGNALMCLRLAFDFGKEQLLGSQRSKAALGKHCDGAGVKDS